MVRSREPEATAAPLGAVSTAKTSSMWPGSVLSAAANLRGPEALCLASAAGSASSAT